MTSKITFFTNFILHAKISRAFNKILTEYINIFKLLFHKPKGNKII